MSNTKGVPMLSSDAVRADTATPLVGIGASAGGVDALEAFFEALPPSPGLAFVVVTHLSPDHESNLASILQRHACIPVKEATDGIVPEPDTAYVQPPDTEVRLEEGRLRVTRPIETEGPPSAIDTFFCSLAADHGEAAIGVVLSGSGTDGTMGVRKLKEEGAFAMAQSPDEADYDGMPQSALDTGLVDVIDSAANLAADLPVYWQHITEASVPYKPGELAAEDEEALKQIFDRVRDETGHDLSKYKQSTILRRIRRRMAVHHLSSLSAYLKELTRRPDEIRALFREALISVTQFFRDPGMFERLADVVIPRLFEGKGPDEEVRVWSAGCATGEEAYSLAMLLDEHAATMERPPEIQVFATDRSPEAIDWAREGRYPTSVASDLSPDRQGRYFRVEDEYYQVRQALRDQVLFAEHDLLSDPPFSEIDLVACRNVLIYLRHDVHEHILNLFHYALREEGYLCLGDSETVSAAPELFSSVAGSPSLFRRQSGESSLSAPFFLSETPQRTPDATVSVPASATSASSTGPATLQGRALSDGVASILVDQNREIVHLTEPATRHLRYQGGKPTHDVLEAVPKAVRAKLRSALRTAFRNGTATGPTVIEANGGDGPGYLTLRVRPLGHLEEGEGVAQVLLDPAAPSLQRPANFVDEETQAYVEELEAELEETKEELQNTIEEYETTTEELETSNEELLSMNEQLQSKNEEIETSKEELQSINEELKTTNQELKTKVQELAETNGHLRNLMQATNVATLFLDEDLRIDWFTPPVRKHFGIRDDDAGRPIADFAGRFYGDDVISDAEDVLEAGHSLEREIQSEDGRWFLLRMRPYQTVDDEEAGVVITFVDVTDRKEAELEIREERNFVKNLLNTVGALVVVLDAEHRIVRFNEKCEAVTGYMAEEVEGMRVYDLLVPDEEVSSVRSMLEELEGGGSVQHEHHWVPREGAPRLIRWSNTTLSVETGSVEYLIGTGVDITRRRELEREVIAISDKERQRIGQDLHDLLASQLSGTSMMAQSIAQKIERGEDVTADDVSEISELIREASKQARELSHALTPLDIQGHDLVDGLENLTHQKAKMANVPCTVNVEGTVPDLDPDVSAHLYRIASEAVTNAIEHGEPSQIDIQLDVDDELCLTVVDDGTGFSPSAVPESSLGINMMRYRSDLIGADLTIESVDGDGTQIQCSMPVSQAVLAPDEKT